MKLDTYPGGVYFVDFEYHPENGREGNAPDPVCMVVAQFGTSNISRYWQDELRAMECPPFPVDAACLSSSTKDLPAVAVGIVNVQAVDAVNVAV